MDGFAKHFDLYKNIHFLTDVQKIAKCPETGKWMVTVLPGRGCEATLRFAAREADPNAVPETHAFDGVCICTGTNTWACLPKFPGEEKFKGRIIHTEDYHTPDEFAGQRVLVVGAGESGSDICNEISKVAAKTCIAIRGKHGHLIPRIQAHGRVTDLNTNRCRYSNPYIFGDWIGYTNQVAKKWVAIFSPPTPQNKVLKKIGELNLEQKTSAFSKFGCKNEGFVEAMVLRGAELHRDTFELHENKAVFSDGSEFECDSIVGCTGFRNAFPFFEEAHPDLAEAARTPRNNYKQIFNPAFGSEVAFFGFARPAFGAIPPTTEMQARYYSMIINGDLQLPSREEMEAIAMKDRLNYDGRFGYDCKRVKGLVDFQVYCDDLAKLMGCFPPLAELFIKKPAIWWSIMFGPFTMHQYRLAGPYANPKCAEEVYARQPIGDFLECSITAAFLVTAKILSLVGFKADPYPGRFSRR